MEREKMLAAILDSIPYPIVFVDKDHIIRYLNQEARHRYYGIRGYRDLIGKSLFDCHGKESKERILAAVEKVKNHENDIFIKVGSRNERIYLNPVRDENGEFIGYFERFEMNLQK